ncbi:sugar ABC transporter [Trinickia symbiotica]|uniref:Sugar ABC transporter n=1 Tax=Trinickia symbiotica TaxID=863227 RepID=A0A2T3Y0S5_9BURK|nr:sugar ABC transporter ATP-binding protein [Trinickia symbiotica]PTB22373.1 sugar ABC transporter [Trinickia symbiotica]
MTSREPTAGATGNEAQAPAHDGLIVRGIGKTFNRNVVLGGVDLDVRPGTVVALLGENGAGKSTLSSIIAGALQPDPGGRMFWGAKPYAPQSPRDALASGIGLIHQETRLLPDLSIAENVFVGRLPMKHGKIDRAEMARRAQEQLHRLGLDVPTSRLVRTLRVAAQQQVEIAKALTLDARLLILDEPTAALGGAETDRLFEQIAKLRAQGVSFIYISHRLEEIARIADRIVVLRDGQMIATHENGSVPLKTLIEQMVGRNVERIFPRFAEPRERAMLEVRSLSSAQGAFRDISFSVRAGEVFGIAGIVGAGRTELVRAIAGADPVSSGSVIVDGEPLDLKSPAHAIRAGVVLVPEDRKAQGVVLDHSIEDNLAYGSLDRLGAHGWMQPREVREFANRLIARLGVKGRPQQRAGNLSGGNQQKVVLAKWLAREPKVVILDEPTRGIDVGARAAIYEVIAKLAASGVAVVVVSSDLDEVLGLSHRVMVLARGNCTGVLARSEASDVRVMELATA